MIEASALSVFYNDKCVVNDIKFNAEAGRITAIIGPNGSGKTSLLKALSGEVPYRGKATLNGLSISATKAWQLAATRAVLPQFSSVTFPFTVREIVTLGNMALNRNGNSRNTSALAQEALAKVGLASFSGRKYHELSGGEQQRVQFARVLLQVWQPVNDGWPRWLFLDEPVSSLDIQHQLTIMNTAQDFAKKGGGVVSILHDLNLAAMYADQIILMSDGHVLCHGAVKEVLKDDILNEAFGCRLKVGKTPPISQKFVLPQSVNL